ncbi:Clp protease N-terminal domain-containing protein [Streptomyces sp. NPDC046915]|uniref:Clp protease N-terminal domain-containing protein n=1 Tax=Streptomyces sp. NPDC046915 TaxID=3155257 RepID=UPI0033FABEC0
MPERFRGDTRFSQGALFVVRYAEHHARNLRHGHIGTEHLLLGLADEADQPGTGQDLEALLGVSSTQIRGSVLGARGLGRSKSPQALPYSARAKAVLEQAPLEADLLGAADVAPVHILLALTAVDGGTAVDVLRANGVDLGRVRQSVIGGARLGPAEAAESAGLLEAVTRVLVPRPVVGRVPEIDRVIQVLTRHHRNVPLLVGEPGVGKKAVALGVATAIAEGRLPAVLRDHTVRALDLGTTLADPQHRARGGALVADLLDEFRNSPHIVLYLDGALTPLHLPDGVTTPLNLFRHLLGTPDVFVFGDCGRAQYERRAPDPGLDRLVQPVPVEEPSDDDVRTILHTVGNRLANHHDVVFFADALEAAAALAREHVPDQSLPGSAIGLLDEAAALVRMQTARSEPPADTPPPVKGRHVRAALAAYSGIRTATPRPSPAPAPDPAEHDPYIWAMS